MLLSWSPEVEVAADVAEEEAGCAAEVVADAPMLAEAVALGSLGDLELVVVGVVSGRQEASERHTSSDRVIRRMGGP